MCVRVPSHLLSLFFLGIIIPLIFLLILPRSSHQHFLFSVFVLCTILMMVSLYSFDLGFSIFFLLKTILKIYVYVCLYVGKFACACKCSQRPEVNLRYGLLWAIHLFFGNCVRTGWTVKRSICDSSFREGLEGLQVQRRASC